MTVVALGLILVASKKLEKASVEQMLKMGFVGGLIALHWVTFFGAIKYSNVSVALSAMASTAVFTALIDPIRMGKRPSIAELGLGLVTLVGIYIIFHFQKLYAIGLGLGLLSAFICAIFTIQTKDLLSEHGPVNLLFYELVGGLVTLTVLAPAYLYFFPADSLIPSLSDSGYLLVLALLCTVYAMQLSYKALRHVSPFAMNLSVNLEPIYAIVMAAFIFREYEELNLGFYAGASIIIAAVVANGTWFMLKAKKRRKV